MSLEVIFNQIYDFNKKTHADFFNERRYIDWMKCYTVEQIEEALKNAWFSEVKSYRYDNKPWITVIAKK